MKSKLNYFDLGTKQREAYNYGIAVGELIKYGYQCNWLMCDTHGADFIATHLVTQDVIKFQLKGGLSLKKAYYGKGLKIINVCKDTGRVRIIDHDAAVDCIEDDIKDTVSWSERGKYGWSKGAPAKLKHLEIIL